MQLYSLWKIGTCARGCASVRAGTRVCLRVAPVFAHASDPHTGVTVSSCLVCFPSQTAMAHAYRGSAQLLTYNNNNNLLARVIQQYNDQYKKHSNSITVPNGVVAIC